MYIKFIANQYSYSVTASILSTLTYCVWGKFQNIDNIYIGRKVRHQYIHSKGKILSSFNRFKAMHVVQNVAGTKTNKAVLVRRALILFSNFSFSSFSSVWYMYRDDNDDEDALVGHEIICVRTETLFNNAVMTLKCSWIFYRRQFNRKIVVRLNK